ncbi:hypothetical protein LEP1GSC103_1837 [Leptospira borgpetersenii serovar Javanica str. UI 09931]|uniref:Uncharacterized protein n=4 Tax=Leptospira borgpetersenii TaxID=174 RepID=M3HUF5_LEPBO|nr:hypothetical protein LEP1GSC101_4080 [Leptospira borgpetersenii str. UI 09149]EMG01215.1 hypothetical protein LEP1GSC123_0700 [Leptospira borgpetersenii str. 200701203]EMK11040.1 hypothetical protein LEP1GSC066_2334 [Leptospira sp. serovar Kenya str. Sh9]EMN14805.1 hypothetical protein LEP1GSC055_3509 [Leptospira borgpetersenii str. Brem 307]EMN18285.1 hypothetical protein LEP1GSC056_4241 [Leptospira borgpetersenii str. Brem 328]EMN57023.1 hypothetical protein LEP1GSC090_0889 [Leptospira bo
MWSRIRYTKNIWNKTSERRELLCVISKCRIQFLEKKPALFYCKLNVWHINI